MLAALGTTGLAGCSDILGGGDPGPAEYRYDPSVLVETGVEFFGTVDYAGLYEARQYLPESEREFFEGAEDAPVSPDKIDTVTGVGGAQVAVGESSSAAVFGSVAVLGSFGSEAVALDLGDDGAEEIGEYEGFTLYKSVDGDSLGDIPEEEGTAVAAVQDGLLVVGAVGSGGETPAPVTNRQVTEAMVDAGNGDIDRLNPNSEYATQLSDRIGDATVMAGGEVDPDLIEQATAGTGEGSGASMATQLVEGVRAGGFGMAVENATTTVTGLVIYTDAETAENSDVTELVDLTAEQAVAENPGLDSVEAEYDGNAAVVTVEGETETIFEQGGAAGAGGALAVGNPAGGGASLVGR